jgi:CheY-like chemotaxis protein
VDLLVSDIGMPGTDGYQLIAQVRVMDKARPTPLPAIALTAYARAEDRQRSLLAGYQMHISKPVETRELVAGIASLLKLSR